MSGSQICPSCGAASPADAQFCRDCGAILVRSGGSGGPPKTPPLGSDPTFTFEGSGGPGSPRPPDDKRVSVVAVVIVIVVLLVIGAVFFGKRDSSQIPVPGEAPTEVPAEVSPTEPPPPPRREPTRPPAPPPPLPREPESLREPNVVVQPEREPEPERPAERVRPREPERRREPEPELPSVRGREDGRAARGGWYRVKFRAPLFQSPDETAPIITYLRPGTRIRVTRVVSGFLAVESTTGKAPGYVSTDDAVAEGDEQP